MNDHYVSIVEFADPELPERVMGPMSERRAEKVERGVLRNLNTDRFYSVVHSQDELPAGWKVRADP